MDDWEVVDQAEWMGEGAGRPRQRSVGTTAGARATAEMASSAAPQTASEGTATDPPETADAQSSASPQTATAGTEARRNTVDRGSSAAPPTASEGTAMDPLETVDRALSAAPRTVEQGTGPPETADRALSAAPRTIEQGTGPPETADRALSAAPRTVEAPRALGAPAEKCATPSPAAAPVQPTLSTVFAVTVGLLAVLLKMRLDDAEARHDAASAALAQMHLESTNLLLNSGCETRLDDGSSAWVPLAGNWSCLTHEDGTWASATHTPLSGKAFFYPGRGIYPRALHKLYQDVDLSQFGAASVVFDGVMSTQDQGQDPAQAMLEILDADGVTLTSALTEAFDQKAWKRFELSADLPHGAHWARVWLLSRFTAGARNNGYFDDLSLRVVVQ